MALKSAALLIFLTCISGNGAWAGNGSSGVGTASIAKGFGASNLEGSVERIGDEVVDVSTKEKILDVVVVKKEEVSLMNLVKAKFGRVNGFEYVPESLKEKNYWVLCKDGEKVCSKLIPASKTNKKIPSILGSLVEIQEE